MSLVRQLHGGRDYNPEWGRRQTGAGSIATLIASRFNITRRRHGLDRDEAPALDSSRFRIPTRSGEQMGLFGD